MFQFPIGIFNYVEAAGGAEDFTFTVDTTNAGTASDTILLPYSGGNTTYWGDGSDSTSNTHTYSTGGEYEIHIEGDIDGWQFNNSGDRLKLLDIKSWDTLDISLHSAFQGCANMTISATNKPTVSSTNLLECFAGCSSVTSIDWGGVDISKAEGMNAFCSQCTLLETIVMPSNSSNVDTMFNMLRDCDAIVTLDLSPLDTSSVVNMATMLYSMGSLANVTWGTFDIGAVTGIANFLGQTTINTTDYSTLLVNFDAQTVNSGLSFHGGGSKTNAAGTTARTSLETSDSWSITDGGDE